MPTTHLDQLVTVRQSAGRLGVPADRLKKKVLSGAVPTLKAGRKYLLNHSAVESALARLAAGQPAANAEGVGRVS